MAEEKSCAPKFRTSIGGQALIEGILMRGPGKQAIVVRSPEGLVVKEEEITLTRDKYPILGVPVIRGAVTFIDSMVRGVKALMFSADYFPDEDTTATDGDIADITGMTAGEMQELYGEDAQGELYDNGLSAGGDAIF